MKRIFLDTEFTSLTQGAKLLSLALVSESGENFYAVFTDYDMADITPFVAEHVLPYLLSEDIGIVQGATPEVTQALKLWLSRFQNEKIQMWADVPHYDWVLFCELFGGSFHLPENISYMCMDLATLLVARGYDPNVERTSLLAKNEIPENYTIHNALSDAEVGMIILKKLLYGE